MTEFLSALKADLLDRRLLPLVVLVGVALAAALAYAVLGGGSTAATPTAAGPSGPAGTGAPGLSISQTTPEKAVAEMTSGVSAQRHGVARDPFTLLPGAVKSTAASATSPSGSSSASTSSGSASTSSGSGSSSQSSGGSTSTTPSKPSTPAKPKTLYDVAVLFGVVPAGSAPQSVQLTPYENLKLLTPLPSAKQPLVVFRGVIQAGKSVTFTIVGEAILHGEAVCLPSASQCQAIDLNPGQYEQFEYLPPDGQTVTYELRIVSVVSAKASAASASSLQGGESKAGRELLRRTGLLTLPYLRYVPQLGVLVFPGFPAFAARAHGARPRYRKG